MKFLTIKKCNRVIITLVFCLAIFLGQFIGSACASEAKENPLTQENYQEYITITSQNEGEGKTLIRNGVDINYITVNPSSIIINVTSINETNLYQDVNVEIKFTVWARYYNWHSYSWSSNYNKEVTKEILLNDTGCGTASISCATIAKELFPSEYQFSSKTFQMGIQKYEIVSSSGKISIA